MVSGEVVAAGLEKDYSDIFLCGHQKRVLLLLKCMFFGE